FKTDSAGRTADWYREQSLRALKALNAAEATKAKFEQQEGIVMGPGNIDAENVKLAGLQQALMSARASVGAQDYEAVKQS
ncbi:hypothetical protein, partial [Lactococcus petauri]|uniref:hypothetical protein n=1 Tax=Lactococcus petauri TaxID=1940789 RepID=UPI0021F147B2